MNTNEILWWAPKGGLYARGQYPYVQAYQPRDMRVYTQDEKANRAPLLPVDRRPDLPGEPGSEQRIKYYKQFFAKGGEL